MWIPLDWTKFTPVKMHLCPSRTTSDPSGASPSPLSDHLRTDQHLWSASKPQTCLKTCAFLKKNMHCITTPADGVFI